MRRAAAASETVRTKLPLIGLPVKESFSVGAGSHTTSLFSSTPPRASTTYGAAPASTASASTTSGASASRGVPAAPATSNSSIITRKDKGHGGLRTHSPW
jgi:hypothetical protein